jgi:hypothetical protein
MIRRNSSIVGIVLALMMISGCKTTPTPQVIIPPSFPPLALEDHPTDLRGFCLSGDEAAKLGKYIYDLELLLKEK